MKKQDTKDEIRNIRKGLGLTQDQLARLFNKTRPRILRTSRSDITKYETGVSDPPTSKYKKFLALATLASAKKE